MKKYIFVIAVAAVLVLILAGVFNELSAEEYVAPEPEPQVMDDRDMYDKLGDELADAMRAEAGLLLKKQATDKAYADAVHRTNCANQAVNVANNVDIENPLNCTKQVTVSASVK